MSRRTFPRWCLRTAHAAAHFVMGLLCFFVGAVVFGAVYNFLPR